MSDLIKVRVQWIKFLTDTNVVPYIFLSLSRYHRHHHVVISPFPTLCLSAIMCFVYLFIA